MFWGTDRDYIPQANRSNYYVVVIKDGSDLKKIGITRSDVKNGTIADIGFQKNEVEQYGFDIDTDVKYVEIEKWIDGEYPKELHNIIKDSYYNRPGKMQIDEKRDKFSDFVTKYLADKELLNDLKDLLKANHNLVLTGAPGTGKTHLAGKIAQEMMSNKTDEKENINIGFVQFHPSYDYTDFVEGIRPKGDANGFERKDGVFKAFCKKAWENLSDSKKNTDAPENFVFIIDEINRGDMNKILGELFYAIDPGYRYDGSKKIEKVQTQYQNMIDDGDPFKDGFFVPENVYIIGTMNDIDRSVESMDFAIRRRFAWKKITPENCQYSILLSKITENRIDDVIRRMNAMNDKIKELLGVDFQIGASYFTKLPDYDYNYDELWDKHLEGLIGEYLRGKRDSEKEELLNKIKTVYSPGKTATDQKQGE